MASEIVGWELTSIVTVEEDMHMTIHDHFMNREFEKLTPTDLITYHGSRLSVPGWTRIVPWVLLYFYN